MIISDKIRKYVGFVAMRMADDTLRLVGSGFFLGRDREGDKVHGIRFVTARFTSGDGLPLRIHKSCPFTGNRVFSE